MKTKVQTSNSVLIPTYGVSLNKIADVCSHAVEYDYLVGNNTMFCTIDRFVFSNHCLCFVEKIDIFCHFFNPDVIGMLTVITPEREYVKDGKVTKMVVLELTDDR